MLNLNSFKTSATKAARPWFQRWN